MPPVRNRTPQHELPFSLTIRRLFGFWKLLYFDRSPGQPSPRTIRLGAGGIISSRLSVTAPNAIHHATLGAIEPRTRFAGGPDQEGGGLIPNITPFGIGNWSEDDLERALRDGLTPRGRAIGSTMADIVTDIAALPQSDQKATAAYIKSLPTHPTPTP